MEEEKPIVEQIEDKKKNKMKFIRIMSLIFVGIVAIILIVVAVNKPDFPIGRIIGFGIAAIVLGGMGFFYAQINKKLKEAQTKLKEQEDLPKPLTKDEIKPYIESLLKSPDYGNHIKQWGGINSEVINKNIIYYFELELLYDINDKIGNKVIAIVNAHYPNTNLSIISQNASVIVLRRLINSASMSPKDEPDVEETETKNEMLGITSKTKRIKQRRKEDENKKEEKKDIA